ncbi:small integral membrane protein 29 [Coregonus clupeaformis]|nr:small integral membrane protein 29 [Coregonus clupeaformis]
MNNKDEAKTTGRKLVEERTAAAQLLPPIGDLLLDSLASPVPPATQTYAMNSTTQPPAIIDGDVAVSSVLVPFFLITFIGIAAAVVMYVRRKRRIDRLRHQLLPVYTYDPSEELHEVEQEMLWKEEDTKVVKGWARSYQQQRPLLMKDAHA